MSELICTVCVPSRKRFPRLLESVRSVVDQATGTDYEIIIRLDNDDEESIDGIPQLRELSPLVKILVGPRLGYAMLDPGYYTQISEAGTGKWCWCFGDDMLVIGKGWDEKIKDVPLTGYYIEPEVHKLGGSTYRRDSRCGSYWLVRDCWKLAGYPGWPKAADYSLTTKLDQMGWGPWFLEGVTIWHQRDSEDEIQKHHA